MITLQPLTVSQYADLEDKSQYDFAMKYAFKFTDPVDEYHIGDLMELPFGFIKDFQFDIEQGITWEKQVDYFLKVTGLKTIADQPLDKFMRAVNYLVTGIKNIIEVEQTALAYEANDKEQSAGIDRFKDLGIYLQIRSVAISLHMKPDEVRAMKYSDAFVELYTQKQLKEYENDLRKKK